MMYDFFIDLSRNETTWIVYKMLAFTGCAFVVAFLIHAVLIRFSGWHAKEPFPLRYKLVMLGSILGAVVALNILWFLVVFFNDIHHFTWTSFEFNRSNIYWMLSPLLIAHVAMIAFYTKVRSDITKVF